MGPHSPRSLRSALAVGSRARRSGGGRAEGIACRRAARSALRRFSRARAGGDGCGEPIATRRLRFAPCSRSIARERASAAAIAARGAVRSAWRQCGDGLRSASCRVAAGRDARSAMARARMRADARRQRGCGWCDGPWCARQDAACRCAAPLLRWRTCCVTRWSGAARIRRGGDAIARSAAQPRSKSPEFTGAALTRVGRTAVAPPLLPVPASSRTLECGESLRAVRSHMRPSAKGTGR